MSITRALVEPGSRFSVSVFHLDVVCLGCVFWNAVYIGEVTCIEVVLRLLFQITAIVSLTYEAEEFSSHGD